MFQLTKGNGLVDKFLTQAQIAAKLQVSRTTVWRWERDGYLKAHKVGRTKRFDPKQINKLSK